MTYSPPVDVAKYPVTSDFYDSRIKGTHMGIDYATPTGTPVHAIGDGQVQGRLSAEDAGRFVSITHPDGLRSRYLHLSEWSVVVGQLVKKGDVVGLSGNTGTATTGPHLHHDVSAPDFASASKIQPDPVEALGRWRVNPELLFKEDEHVGLNADQDNKISTTWQKVEALEKSVQSLDQKIDRLDAKLNQVLADIGDVEPDEVVINGERYKKV